MRKLSTAVLVAATIASSGFLSSPAQAEGFLSNLLQRRDWQCVTFARAFSGVQIFGDAWTWWQSATGKYKKGGEPEAGAVLVFKKTDRMTRGHVAVVSDVVTERVVQITHANWSPINGRRGQVEQDVTMIDVSDAGDWSEVKVWYGPLADLGGSSYPTYGFIYQKPEAKLTYASAEAAPSYATVGGSVQGLR
jgi:surface antigen